MPAQPVKRNKQPNDDGTVSRPRAPSLPRSATRSRPTTEIIAVRPARTAEPDQLRPFLTLADMYDGLEV
ncbi:hypothetical protein C8E87_5764 [Paractinoplanes brasiliensis]|uniref:Uncharacterized protein n=1 Tax=Paractinoplanes brasiliensis TaxID=52695 RepID=A0A4R6K156_9ACTN|nr:hypothetical protein C8E87_5764 [Actinoplanes brasiliensis]GID33121.1 hypothetical protein Abr02nite_81040 [Actinoplanes brasiliensis]